MARSLLRQLEQIRQSAAYSDTEANVNNALFVENTTVMSGSLEQDLNNLRTLMKDFKGTTNWYDDLGMYFNPVDTNSGTEHLKDFNLLKLKNHTTDAQTVILAVQTDGVPETGTYYTVSGTDVGVLLNAGNSELNTFKYADPNDRRGLPIFESTANTGSFWDEGGYDRVVRIDVLNSDDVQMQDNSGNTIYAKFHDGEDYPGASTGSGTDVWVKFYANGVETDLQNVMISASGTLGTGTIDLYFITPERRVMADVEEWEWMRTDFVSSWEGDIELIEDIMDLWAFVGSGDGVSDAGTWTNTTANYPLASNPNNLWTAIDLLNTAGGDATYSGATYITTGEDYTTSIEKLDIKLAEIAGTVASGVAEKYVEEVSGDISAETFHATPASYTIDAGENGQNMDVYVGGQLLAASTGVNGANGDRDYAETSTSGITFHFNIQDGRNITYMIRA